MYPQGVGRDTVPISGKRERCSAHFREKGGMRDTVLTAVSMLGFSARDAEHTAESEEGCSAHCWEWGGMQCHC